MNTIYSTPNCLTMQMLSDALCQEPLFDESCSDGYYYAYWNDSWCTNLVSVLTQLYQADNVSEMFELIHRGLSQINFGHCEPPPDLIPEQVMQWFFEFTPIDSFSEQGEAPSVVMVLVSTTSPDLSKIQKWIDRPAFADASDMSNKPLIRIAEGLLEGSIYPDPETSSFANIFLGEEMKSRASTRCGKCVKLWKKLIRRGLSVFDSGSGDSKALSVLRKGLSYSSFCSGGYDSSFGGFTETTQADSAAIKMALSVMIVFALENDKWLCQQSKATRAALHSKFAPSLFPDNDQRGSSARSTTAVWGSSEMMTVGKYRGMTFGEIRRRDPGYCRWVLGLAAPFLDMVRFQRYLKAVEPPRWVEDAFYHDPLDYVILELEGDEGV